MEIYSLPTEPTGFPTVTALGFFDGGHIGHSALLERTVAYAKEARCVSAVFSFPSLPTKKGTPLSTLADRLSFFEKAGIDCVFLAPFGEVRDLSAEDFVRLILKEKLHTKKALCGFNYRFGKGAVGDSTLLTHLLPGSTVLSPTLYGGTAVSATRIREALAQGDIASANEMLGHLYTVKGQVTHGKAMGRSLGFPTANVTPKTALPRYGVYQTRVFAEGTFYTGLTNVGMRPTLENAQEARTETFLPDFSGDLYGKEIEISFLSFLRQEKRFSSAEALAEQIKEDLKQIKKQK